MRIYKTAPGFYGLGISKSSEGWSLQIAKWVICTTYTEKRINKQKSYRDMSLGQENGENQGWKN